MINSVLNKSFQNFHYIRLQGNIPIAANKSRIFIIGQIIWIFQVLGLVPSLRKPLNIESSLLTQKWHASNKFYLHLALFLKTQSSSYISVIIIRSGEGNTQRNIWYDIKKLFKLSFTNVVDIGGAYLLSKPLIFLHVADKFVSLFKDAHWSFCNCQIHCHIIIHRTVLQISLNVIPPFQYCVGINLIPRIYRVNVNILLLSCVTVNVLFINITE